MAEQPCEAHSHYLKDGVLFHTVDLAIKAFDDMLLKEIATHSCGECIITALQQRLSMLSKLDPDFLALDQITKTERITDEHRDSIFEVQRLKGDLEASEEECKQLHQVLKHWEHEKRVAIDRARTAEEDLKKSVALAEADRKQATHDRKKAQQWQAKVDDLQLKLQQKQTTQDDNDAGKKMPKDATNSDISGLQRGLEKVKLQLKKKQDEFQAKVQALQTTTKKLKDLEEERAKDQENMYDLKRELDGLIHIQKEETAENTSGYIRAQFDLKQKERQLEGLARQFEALKERYREQQASQTALDRALKIEKEKNKRLIDKISKLTAYEPLGVRFLHSFLFPSVF